MLTAPRTDPYGPNLGIRFLPRVFDGKAHMWPGMKVARLRKPVVGQSQHPFPRETVFLATPPERAVPEPYHVAAESADTRAVRGNRVIGKVAPDDLRQPTSPARVLYLEASRRMQFRIGMLHPEKTRLIEFGRHAADRRGTGGAW